jgi:hypothetical protein
VAYLRDRLGEGVVVRSDDIDGNDIIGTVTSGDGTAYHYRAHATDGGEILGADIVPV